MLIVALVLLLVRRNNLNLPPATRQSLEFMALPSADMAQSSKMAPPSEDSDRLIITDTSLSLVVKDVAKAITDIQSTTTSFDGFLIDSHLSQPESAASGSISVRIPSDKLPQALSAFKGLAVKVVSESISGSDVTDSYTDLSARLKVLTDTKAKFEQILDQATKVTDLLEVQRELTNLQAQIDNLKGQQKYYEQSSKLSKVTVYLSTDALSLPYVPTTSWRPLVIFRSAVRSLLSLARLVANLFIYLAVFIPVIVPAVLLIRFVKKRKTR